MSAGKPITDETILLLWVKGAHYMWLKEEQEAPITPKKEEKEKQQDTVSPNYPNPLESEDASGVPGPSINLLELLKKKKENPEPYRLIENALTDEEIIKIIQSLKHGDESLNMLDDYDYDFNKGTKLRGKQSPLYYAGKNFGLPVVKALIDAGADPNKMLKGINVVGVPIVYDGETALDLLVEDFKKILTDKKHRTVFETYSLHW